MKYVLQPVSDSDQIETFKGPPPDEVEFSLNPSREEVTMKIQGGGERIIVFRMEDWAQLCLASARGVRFLVPQEETLLSKG